MVRNRRGQTEAKAGVVEVTDLDAEAKKLIEAAYTLGLAVEKWQQSCHVTH